MVYLLTLDDSSPGGAGIPAESGATLASDVSEYFMECLSALINTGSPIKALHGGKMRKITLAIVILAVVITGVAMAQDKKHAIHCDAGQMATIEIPQLVIFNGVFLKGTYVVVHDDVKMARGENCTYVYEYANNERGRLVTSFHCTPVHRERAASFKMVVAPVTQGPSGIAKVVEFQFAGSTEGHMLPLG